MCEHVEPTTAQLALFGPAPRRVDDAPFEPVYLEVTPEFVTVHSTDGGLELAHRHCP